MPTRTLWVLVGTRIHLSAYPEGLASSGRDNVSDNRPIRSRLPEKQAHFLVTPRLDAELVSDIQPNPRIDDIVAVIPRRSSKAGLRIIDKDPSDLGS